MLFKFEKNLIFVKFFSKLTSSFIRGISQSQFMAGGKKQTGGKQEKSTTKDSKKKKDKGESGPKKAEITGMVNEQQAMKIIQNSKVVTVQDLARQTGVKISAANAFLKNSAEKGTVKRIGGYSGHHLYQSVSS